MKSIFITLCLLLSINTFAKVNLVETIEYKDIFKEINRLGKKHGSENILIVFDVDDTLLVIEHCLINGKLTKGIGKLFNCPSEPTEEDLAEKLHDLQRKGYNTIALTARGASMIKVTQRELARQEMSFTGTPYKKDQTLLKEKKKCKKRQTPPCYTKLQFKNGVMYANGSNKGWMLKTLLEKLGDDYKHIIFVDDRKKNIKNISTVYKPIQDINMNLFLYLRHRD